MQNGKCKYEVFLPSFKAAVTEAGIMSVMALYNEFDSVPSQALSATLFQSRPIRHIFRECGNHGPPFFTNRSSNNHSLRFIPAKLARFEVCHHDHLAAYK